MDLGTQAGGDEQPTLAFPTGERCGACGAPLARDQRYCIACGERRGKPRLPFMDGRPRHAPPAPAAPAAPGRARRPSASAGTTLVAGIGTLVLAMGVGVLIGRSGNGDGGGVRAAAPAVQVVTVAGAGGGAADTTATTDTGSSKASKKAKVTTLPRSKLPPPTVTIGQRGSGPGFQHGRFTGNFFGP